MGRREKLPAGVTMTVLAVLLPLLFKLDGVWMSVVAAELVALWLTTFCILRYRNPYHYLQTKRNTAVVGGPRGSITRGKEHIRRFSGECVPCVLGGLPPKG